MIEVKYQCSGCEHIVNEAEDDSVVDRPVHVELVLADGLFDEFEVCGFYTRLFVASP